MQLILLEKVDGLGGLGDVVSVRPGYARNYLLPKGRAKVASEANIEEFKVRRAELERIAEEVLSAANERAEALHEQTVNITANAGTEGKLFGSVTTTEIALAIIAQLGVAVEKREVRLPEGSLRHVGEFSVDLHLHSEVNVTITVNVIAEM